MVLIPTAALVLLIVGCVFINRKKTRELFEQQDRETNEKFINDILSLYQSIKTDLKINKDVYDILCNMLMLRHGSRYFQKGKFHAISTLFPILSPEERALFTVCRRYNEDVIYKKVHLLFEVTKDLNINERFQSQRQLWLDTYEKEFKSNPEIVAVQIITDEFMQPFTNDNFMSIKRLLDEK